MDKNNDRQPIAVSTALTDAIDIIVTGRNLQAKVEWVLQNYLRYRQKMAAIDSGVIKDALESYEGRDDDD